MMSHKRFETRSGVTGVRGLGLLAGFLPVFLAGAAPAPAAAQVQGIGLGVVVSHISDQPGRIDPRGQRIHQKLSAQIRYQSLSVLQTHQMKLGLNEGRSLSLPNSRSLRVRATDIGERGVLLNVDVEGSVQTDLRVKNGHLVVFGTEPYDNGKLVISLEPTW